MSKKHFVYAALTLWAAHLLYLGLRPDPAPKVFGLLHPGEPAGRTRAEVLPILPLCFRDKHFLRRLRAEPAVARLGLDEEWLRAHLRARLDGEAYLLRVSVEGGGLGRPDQAAVVNACMALWVKRYERDEELAEGHAAIIVQGAPPGHEEERREWAARLLEETRAGRPRVVAWAEP